MFFSLSSPSGNQLATSTSGYVLRNNVNSGATSANNRYLFSNLDEATKPFNPKVTISTLFLEVDGEILVLKRSKKEDQSYTWGIPGGKLEAGEDGLAGLVREMREETGIDVNHLPVQHVTDRYAQIPGWDYILKIYRLVLDQKPEIELSDEHLEHKWVPIPMFKTLKLLLAQNEAFDCVYELRPRTLDRSIAKQKIDSKKNGKTIISLIGTSGSGKGTQGVYLNEKTGLPHISIGDLFRDELRNSTLLGDLIKVHDAKHPMIYCPDEICLGIMSRRLGQPDCANGFILDGFPRTPGQADALLKCFMRPEDKHVPIFMDLSEDIIRARLTSRYICPSCGNQVRGHDGDTGGSCTKPSCNGAALEHRAEDIDETKLSRRFGIFNDNITPILSILEGRDLVHYMNLNGSETPQDVAEQIDRIIFESLNPIVSKTVEEAYSATSTYKFSCVIS